MGSGGSKLEPSRRFHEVMVRRDPHTNAHHFRILTNPCTCCTMKDFEGLNISLSKMALYDPHHVLFGKFPEFVLVDTCNMNKRDMVKREFNDMKVWEIIFLKRESFEIVGKIGKEWSEWVKDPENALIYEKIGPDFLIKQYIYT